MVLCLKAWIDLDSERNLGFGTVGPIPWRAQVEWAKHHGFGRAETEVLLSVLRRLDRDRADRENTKRK